MKIKLFIIIKRFIGKWRLWWSFCPQCNSDAPELYDCPVCKFYTGVYPIAEKTRSEWWERFNENLTIRN